MRPAPPPENEMQRLASLAALGILDTPPEERFDTISRLAKSIFDVPIVLISLVDEKRQWFKSAIGVSMTETPREQAFCGYTILSEDLFIVPDAQKDPRFIDNPLVNEDPHIRFYAGYPLHAKDGSAIGSFCIIDNRPREFSPENQLLLQKLGSWVENKINATEDNTPLTAAMTIKEIEDTTKAMVLVGHDQRIIMVNQGFKAFFNISAERVIGLTGKEVVAVFARQFANSPQVSKIFNRILDDREGEFTEYITQMEPKMRDIMLVSFPLQHANPAECSRLFVFCDVSDQSNVIELLQYQAQHDPLTNLPNRAHFQELIEEILLKPGANKRSSLLILNLNHFKEVNETFGHHEGDSLLLQVSKRLSHALTVPGIISRLGSDEFAIFLPESGIKEAGNVVQSILTALEESFTVANMPVQIDVSIGGAFYPTNGKNTQTLLRQADIAASEAKRTRTSYALYNPDADRSSAQRLALTAELRRAIADDKLELYYQPKANARTGKIHSVETLLRWKHPIHGFIPPDRFIPLAEQTGLIAPLSLWVIKNALKQCRLWREAGLEIMVSINLSMWNLRDISLPDTIANLLKENQLPGSLLCVEVTESAIMTDMKSTIQVLVRLAALGISISLDDFGTGYSSLAYLKRLPIDELKIDRSFIQHIVINQVDAAIVASMVELAHQLNLIVVAEGIEDQTTWNHLAMLGCDLIQGYHLARPMPGAEFERWMNSRFAKIS